MADATPTSRFRFWLWLIRLIGVLVPCRLRLDDEYWDGFPRATESDPGQDELGFDNDLPSARSEDQAFGRPFHVLSYYWSGSASFGPYTYYWSAGDNSSQPSRGWTFYWPGAQ